MKRILAFVMVLLFVAMAVTVFAEEPKTVRAAPAAETQAATPAQTPPKVDTGDTAWVLISSALVLLMTPGLAFFMGAWWEERTCSAS